MALPRYHDVSPNRPWTTGRTNQLPWQGFLAIFIAILTMIGAITVVISSNDVDIDTWPNLQYSIQPGVVLAILSAIANMALRYSLSEGARFAWWNRALMGSTLKELHEYWSCGVSLKDSLLSGRNFNVVALASVITTLVVADSPLLQRSVSVSSKTAVEHEQLSIPIFSGPLPTGFSGLYMTRSTDISMLSQNFSQVLRKYTARDNMTLNTSCVGVCNTELIAAGFDVLCSRTSEPYDIVEHTTSAGAATGDEYDVGGIGFSWNGRTDGGTIGFNVKYKGDPHCTGSFTNVNCTLRSGTVRYPVTFQNDTITLVQEETANNTVQLYDPGFETSGLGVFGSTLGGFYSAMGHMFSSNVKLYMSGIWAVLGQGALKDSYISSNQDDYRNCTIAWSDPTPDILSTMRELMFRSALILSDDLAHQNVSARRVYDRTVYQAHYSFLTGALALMLANTVILVPLFLGWWRMGRPFSMSPLELAKAFRSPLLVDSGSNQDVDGLLRSAGQKKVRYGELTNRSLPHHSPPKTTTAQSMDSGSQEGLVMEMHEMTEAADDGEERRILGMGDFASTSPPLQGARYN